MLQNLLVLGFVLFNSQSSAAALPSGYIVKRIAESHAGVKKMTIISRVIAYEEDQLSGTGFRDVTMYDHEAGVLKSIAYDDDRNVIYSVERQMAVWNSQVPALAYLFYSANVDAVIDSVKSLSIPVLKDSELLVMKDEFERRAAEQVFFRRWNEGRYWVLYNEATPVPRPELWIKKDTFRPNRIIVPGLGTFSDPIEVLVDRYQTHRATDFPYPGELTLVQSGRKTLKVETKSFSNKVSAKKYGEVLVPGFTERGNQLDGKLKDLIQTYYSVLR